MREAVSGLQRHTGVAPTEICEFHWNAMVAVARPPAWLMRPWTMIGGETTDVPHSDGYLAPAHLVPADFVHFSVLGVDRSTRLPRNWHGDLGLGLMARPHRYFPAPDHHRGTNGGGSFPRSFANRRHDLARGHRCRRNDVPLAAGYQFVSF
jgi:hypothetical protein